MNFLPRNTTSSKQHKKEYQLRLLAYILDGVDMTGMLRWKDARCSRVISRSRCPTVTSRMNVILRIP